MDLTRILKNWLDSSPPNEGEPVPDAAPELDWKAELRREYGLSAPGSAVSASEAAGPGGMVFSYGTSFKPGQVPPDFATYRALLHHVFDARKRELALAAVREPVFRAAYAAWTPGALRSNLNVLYEVYDHLSPIMGRIYRFHPAPLGYAPSLEPGISGQYSHEHKRIMLSESLLRERVEEMFATIVHEQVHKLQHEMSLRIDWASPYPLTLEERALVYYWRREEHKRVPGYSRSPMYRQLGIEYHAFDTEETVVTSLNRAFRS